VVAYYALTGVRPFDGDAIGALVMAITSSPTAPPSVHNRALGPTIDAWMAKALARPREQRFQSAKEMAEAFQQAVAGSASISQAQATMGPSFPVGSDGVPARTDPTAFRASTMSPSVRPDSSELPIRKGSAAPWILALSGVTVVVLGGAAWGISRFTANEAAPSATVSALPSPAEATLAPQPAAAAPEPPAVLAPPAAAPEPPVASSTTTKVPTAAPPTAAKPSRHVAATPVPAKVTAAPATPAAATPIAAAPTPAVAPAPAKPTIAPKPAVAPANPLKMKME
jgi:serine/threonine-protein kinase